MANKSSCKSCEDKKIFRLLDANLNRCREGLRVLEDTARFVRGNETLFRRLRRSRHGLDRLTRKTYPKLVENRNSHEDAGRKIKEGKRKDLKSIIIANFKRCEESLRVLEEYGKIFSAHAGREFKKIRFGIYDLEKETVSQCNLKIVEKANSKE